MKRRRSLVREGVAQRLFAGLLLAVGLIGFGALMVGALSAPLPGSDNRVEGTPLADPSLVALPSDRHGRPVEGARVLVLHSTPAAGNEGAVRSEIHGVFAANLVGHFGSATLLPVSDYTSDLASQHDAVVYVGADEAPMPATFLADVRAGTFPVLWLGNGIMELRDDSFYTRYGWFPGLYLGPDVSSHVVYKDTVLGRDVRVPAPIGIMDVDTNRAQVMASIGGSALEADISAPSQPYVVRSGNLTFMAESPFDHMREANHSLVLADLLFDLLDPDRPTQHRAMVRLEDVGPWADPDKLRKAADALSERGVPFTLAVYPIWRDPLAHYDLGTDIRLSDRPEVVEAIRYCMERGGSVIMHGVTHQWGETANPYSGVSGEDYEFYQTTIDDEDFVRAVSPVEGDSVELFTKRIEQGFAEFADAGLPLPTVFEFPHYLGSPNAQAAVEPLFDARYEQVSYYPRQRAGQAVTARPFNQIYPYPVRDVMGEMIIPENLGNIIVEAQNNNIALAPEDLVERAARSMVVRDNIASFFFHPYLELDYLTQTVDGITAAGYQFVSLDQLLEERR